MNKGVGGSARDPYEVTPAEALPAACSAMFGLHTQKRRCAQFFSWKIEPRRVSDRRTSLHALLACTGSLWASFWPRFLIKGFRMWVGNHFKSSFSVERKRWVWQWHLLYETLNQFLHFTKVARLWQKFMVNWSLKEHFIDSEFSMKSSIKG